MVLARGRLILGINCTYHESAAALVRDGEIVFAVEEERFTRVKHAKAARISNPDELPWNAIKACLESVPDCTLSDLDAIACSFDPGRRLALIGVDPYELDDEGGFGTSKGEEEFNSRVLGVPQILARAAGDESVAGKLQFVPHHRAHAASAFYTCGFSHAAVLVGDGIGETSTAWLGRGSPDGLERIEEIPYPHSIGMLWERVAVYLGFTAYDACKVMGLAAFGDPRRFRSQFDRLFRVTDRDGGSIGHGQLPFLLDPVLARLRSRDVRGLESLFGHRRTAEDPPELERFADVAAGLQRRTEEVILALARRLARATGESDLVYAGGVALNCVANARLEREGPFRSIFIVGAAHDAGTAIGAGLHVAYESDAALRHKRATSPRVLAPFLGPSYDDHAIANSIACFGYRAEKVRDPAAAAASLIAEGRIVGWFQGPTEYGPRALGGRSLLADPRGALVRLELNLRIKHRESFRPFGASVLAEDAHDWFIIPTDRPGAASCRDLMVLAYPVRAERASLIPAVLHHDGTCRLQIVDRTQNPPFHALISRFRELSGVPLVLNTSFNDQEPMVSSPVDALRTFARTEIDILFWEITLSGERDKGIALHHLEAPRGSTIPSSVPRREILFEVVRDRYGPRLALVFGNHAPGGFCPYYTGELCYHCDIGAGEGVAFDHTTNRQRLAWLADYYHSQLHSIRHLVLYNSGSILNPREMTTELLDEILAFARSLPSVRVISLDSREAYITPGTLKRILSVVGDGFMVRPILGIESADDRIRNEVLKKRMPGTAITRVFSDLGAIAAEYGKDRVGLDVNIVIGGPGTTALTAVDDAVMTARYALSAGAQYGLYVDLNLHPYYVGSRGAARFPDHPRCSVATTRPAAAKIVELARSIGSDSRIFIGWQDEAHDLEQQQRSLEMKCTRSVFDRFNQTNDPRVLLEGLPS